MLCQKCHIIPTQKGNVYCYNCKSHAEEQTAEPKKKGATVKSSPAPLTSNNLVGQVIEYQQSETSEALGIRCLNAVLIKERWSFQKEIHYLRLRTTDNQLLDVVIFGKLKGNYLLSANQELEVFGEFNRHHQLVAERVQDVGTRVVYKTSSYSYWIALLLLLFHLLVALIIGYTFYSLTAHIWVSLISGLAYLVLFFTVSPNQRS